LEEVNHMARATKTATKPAEAKQPATKQPAADTGVGIKELSAALGRTPKSTRASIRRLRGGAQVGQGGRYRWDSTEDPDFQELLTKLSTSKDETE
jgi:hypothetical protein